jgi:hypothetical protein
VQDAGLVDAVYVSLVTVTTLRIFEPPPFFEALVRGRRFTERSGDGSGPSSA